jgi:hypothetical protein
MFKSIISKIIQMTNNSADELLYRENVVKIQKHSLIHYYGNVHSQRGQDGIISEILRRLKIDKGFFVEFGAWDGIYLSNTRFLYEKGWNGCLIEGNRKKYLDIVRYFDNKSIKMINGLVGFSHSSDDRFKKPLDEILAGHNINLNTIDLLVIDIDGFDLEILKDLTFRPKIIIIEGGFDFSPFYTKSIDYPIGNAGGILQQPLGYIFKTGIDRGYVPVCFLQDTYLIREDLFNMSLFNIDNSVVTLYKDAFFFMSSSWNRQLLQKRSRNKIIIKLETSEFGYFNVDPLGYENI